MIKDCNQPYIFQKVPYSFHLFALRHLHVLVPLMPLSSFCPFLSHPNAPMLLPVPQCPYYTLLNSHGPLMIICLNYPTPSCSVPHVKPLLVSPSNPSISLCYSYISTMLPFMPSCPSYVSLCASLQVLLCFLRAPFVPCVLPVLHPVLPPMPLLAQTKLYWSSWISDLFQITRTWIRVYI